MIHIIPTNWSCIQMHNGAKVGGLQALAGVAPLAIPVGLTFDNVVIRPIGGSVVLTTNSDVPAVGNGRSYNENTDYLDSAENARSMQLIQDTATGIYVEFYKVK